MYSRLIKRPLDTLSAGILLLLLAPVGIILAVIIRLTSGAPIVFRQLRSGLHGDDFIMYKYRTMSCDNNVTDTATENKMTKIGKFIRAVSLDEVPQLMNIVKGEMSFIGPRPWIPEYYKVMSPKQRKRCEVLPGITGLAQVMGRNSLSVHDKINYDLHYVDNISLREDAKIIFLTLRAIFKKGSKYIEKSHIHHEIRTLKLQHSPKYASSNGVFFSELTPSNKEVNRVKRNSKLSKGNPMQNKELVSIVIPVYNAAKFIEQTIVTIQNQTYSNWEAIFVDDYSSDNSTKIIEKHLKKDKRIKLFKNSINCHAALTRNKGIDEAGGRYIAFLDADDLWEPSKLEKQIEFMEKKDCAFSFTGYEFADEKGIPNGKKVIVPSELSYKQALRNTIIWTTTVMFDMKKLSKENIHMPNVKSEDTACWWKVLKQIDYAYGMPDILSYYRRSSGTLSANKLEAVKRVWNLYRNVENHNLFLSAYCFTGYAYNTVKKRV